MNQIEKIKKTSRVLIGEIFSTGMIAAWLGGSPSLFQRRYTGAGWVGADGFRRGCFGGGGDGGRGGRRARRRHGLNVVEQRECFQVLGGGGERTHGHRGRAERYWWIECGGRVDRHGVRRRTFRYEAHRHYCLIYRERLVVIFLNYIQRHVWIMFVFYFLHTRLNLK